ncbi:MAG: hypothetical protein JWO82_4125 [Akkermansiaceae bacterium]|nr:hypothetical protein [Akkermansiaceae bacterium]
MMTGDLIPLVQICRRHPEVKFEIRGEGRARFIFGTTASKAFELSICEEGYFFEGWDKIDPNSVQAPQISVTENTLDQVADLLHDFLKS